MYDAELDQGVRLHDAPVEYFGPPSEEIDDAWKELLRGKASIRNDLFYRSPS